LVGEERYEGFEALLRAIDFLPNAQPLSNPWIEHGNSESARRFLTASSEGMARHWTHLNEPKVPSLF